ncbi:MAG TPA: thioredoxin family protein [Opitutaceae bacterium]|nr:thioredoxin family protein [Opitutaceae bacterium]
MNTFLRRFFFVGFVLPVALARAADSAVPFRAISFEAATAAAAKEGKLVFIDFYTTWCEPCKRLDAATWTDAAVGRLVGEKAVALKIDAEKEGLELAKRYKISAYPTLLLVKPDGTEVDRVVGFREAPMFIREFNGLLTLAQSGKTGLEQAKEAVAQQARPAAAAAAPASDGEPEDAQPHFDLARKLIQAGQHEEALKELIWCWDEGKKDPEFSRNRSSLVAMEFSRLARDLPAVREVMLVRRDQAHERVIANKGGSVSVQDLIQLNKALKDDENTIVAFDRMPEGDRRRATVSIYLFDYLLERQRYKDAVWNTMFTSAVSMLEQSKMRSKAGPQMSAALVVGRTAKQVEALAGAGQLEQAQELAERLLAFDGSEDTKALLQKHAARAGKPELFAAPPVAIPGKG